MQSGYDPDHYPFNIPAVRHLEKMGSLTLEKPVTFFVGENGTGKSTLIEAIAVAMGFNGEGGSRDFFLLHTGHPFGIMRLSNDRQVGMA